MDKKRLLIAIEGIDGCGKTSLAHALKKSLEKEGHKILLTKEPGDTTLGRNLRTILHEEKSSTCDLAEYLLFAADRAQHFEQMIIPALEQETIVISDRMADSSLAYQGYGRNLDIQMIREVNQWAMQNITPDLIFYIKLDFPTALKRIMQRGNKLTSFETEEELFWKRVSDGFEIIFKNRKNVVAMNGNDSIESLAKQAIKEIIRCLTK